MLFVETLGQHNLGWQFMAVNSWLSILGCQFLAVNVTIRCAAHLIRTCTSHHLSSLLPRWVERHSLLITSSTMPPKIKPTAIQGKDATYPMVETEVQAIQQNDNVSASRKVLKMPRNVGAAGQENLRNAWDCCCYFCDLLLL